MPLISSGDGNSNDSIKRINSLPKPIEEMSDSEVDSYLAQLRRDREVTSTPKRTTKVGKPAKATETPEEEEI